ncbi:MAG: rhomboid family intramembrane serine protease [Thermoguttaceae bacterium]
MKDASHVNDATHSVAQEAKGIVGFVGVIWIVFLLDLVIFPVDFNQLGLVPRSFIGLAGIVTMPFLHQDFGHLMSNSVPLLILLALLAGSRARSWAIVGETALLGGALLWLFGRPASHVGASGLVFGLIAFLIVSGLLEKRILPLIVSLIVGFFYGGTLLSGILPVIDSKVSWDGHLCGAVAGTLVAYSLTRRPTEDRSPQDA